MEWIRDLHMEIHMLHYFHSYWKLQTRATFTKSNENWCPKEQDCKELQDLLTAEIKPLQKA